MKHLLPLSQKESHLRLQHLRPRQQASAANAPATKAPAKPAPLEPAVASQEAEVLTSSPEGSPNSSPPPPTERTQQYLQNAQSARLAASEALQTPPPKSSFESPVPSPSTPGIATHTPAQPEEWHYSQVSYFASQGKSWWSSDAGPGAKNWWFDHDKRRYVFARGTECWVSKTDDWDGDWVLQVDAESPPPSGESGNEGGGATSPNGPRDFLRSRQPTSLSDVDTPAPPADDKGSSPQHGGDDDADDGDDNGEPQATGNFPPEDKFRLDKHGNEISPEALYMRFYRHLRSILVSLRI